MANFMDSGLDFLSNKTFAVDPYESKIRAQQKINATPQPFTPRAHNPLITPSQATDDISWAGGEGWSEEQFGGPGWTYGGNPNTGGGVSISFGGGGGGGGRAPIPNNLLTPRTFPTYTSTYTPPTPATPDPYNWATRDPYIYGEGLSNEGAAYDIWGSAPGTNPYLLSTTSNYTPGLLGMQPVQLPANVPSTNVSANINNNNNGGDRRQKFTGTPEQIIRDYGYYDRTAPMQNNVPPSMRDSAPNAGVMLSAAAANVKNGIYPNMQAAMDAQVAFSKKYPAKTPAENAALIKASQDLQARTYNPAAVQLAKDRATIKNTQGQTINQQLAASAGQYDKPRANAVPGGGTSTAVITPAKSSYTQKKEAAKKSVASYNASPAGKKYSIDLAPRAGTLGGRPRL